MRWTTENSATIPSSYSEVLESLVSGCHEVRRLNGVLAPFRHTELLQKLQHCLLGLVCLLQCSHASGLENVVLWSCCSRFYPRRHS